METVVFHPPALRKSGAGHSNDLLKSALRDDARKDIYMTTTLWPEQTKYASTIAFLTMLLCGDAIFILVHIIHTWTPWLNSANFSLETDRGLAEAYQYLKLLWILICLVMAFLQTHIRVFAGWVFLFAFLLVDDVTQFHERIGFKIGDWFDIPGVAGLRPMDFGELAFAACIGCLALVVVVFAFRRGSASGRHVSRDIFCLIGVLAFFGVVVDAVHVVADFNAPGISRLLALIEDGGEMVAVSMIGGYIFDIVNNGGALRIDVWGMVKGLRQSGMEN